MPADWGGIHRQRIALIDDAWVEPEILGRAVIVQEAVVLPFHIVQFREDIGRNLLVSPQFVSEKFEAPTYVPISIERAYSAVLAVDQRLPFMFIAGDIIKFRPD